MKRKELLKGLGLAPMAEALEQMKAEI